MKVCFNTTYWQVYIIWKVIGAGKSWKEVVFLVKYVSGESGAKEQVGVNVVVGTLSGNIVGNIISDIRISSRCNIQNNSSGIQNNSSGIQQQ